MRNQRMFLAGEASISICSVFWKAELPIYSYTPRSQEKHPQPLCKGPAVIYLRFCATLEATDWNFRQEAEWSLQCRYWHPAAFLLHRIVDTDDCLPLLVSKFCLPLTSEGWCNNCCTATILRDEDCFDRTKSGICHTALMHFFWRYKVPYRFSVAERIT